jgi:hypothetical protein
VLSRPNPSLHLHLHFHDQVARRSSKSAMMDHEKPQAVSPPQVFEFDIDHSRTSPEDLEPDYTEERRERRGESLWFVGLYLQLGPSLIVNQEDSH